MISIDCRVLFVVVRSTQNKHRCNSLSLTRLTLHTQPHTATHAPSCRKVFSLRRKSSAPESFLWSARLRGLFEFLYHLDIGSSILFLVNWLHHHAPYPCCRFHCHVISVSCCQRVSCVAVDIFGGGDGKLSSSSFFDLHSLSYDLMFSFTFLVQRVVSARAVRWDDALAATPNRHTHTQLLVVVSSFAFSPSLTHSLSSF